MNTKTLMITSSVFLGLSGIALSFAPQEIASSFSLKVDPIVLQLLGAAYFGFAMINWTAKANLIGGIYGRPVAIGNFSHFTVGGLALIKSPILDLSSPLSIVFILLYVLFGVIFGYVFFNHPRLKTGS